MPTTFSTHSLNFGIFWPENWYLLPVIWTDPSSPSKNSVSLNPQPLCLNHCSLFRMDSPAFTSYFSKEHDKCCNLSMYINYKINNNKKAQTNLLIIKIFWPNLARNIFDYLPRIQLAQVQYIRLNKDDVILLQSQLNILVVGVKMGCSFSSEDNMNSSLKRIKRDKIIHVSSLNYCGILKSPFEFYSGSFHSDLKKLSQIFDKLKAKYVKIPADKPFSWQFSKLDKKIKEKRYCPLYNLHAGIVDNKFVSKRTFIQLWETALDKAGKEENVQIVESEREEALSFDMLAFHTLLQFVYQVEDIDQMEGKDPKLYIETFQPYFDQAFMDEQKKILKFTEGLQKTLTDIIFIQEGNQRLRQTLQANPKYHVEVSPDEDTMICLNKQKFASITPMRLISLFQEGELSLIDWNNHSTVVIVDKIILISAHLSSNKKINAQNIQTLKKGFQMLREKHADYDIICGADLNSYLKEFNSQIHIYPKSESECTSLKMRTAMQTQSNKTDVLSKQAKDAIITTLPILTGQISTINLVAPNENTYLPDDSHPFDHFLIFAQIGLDKVSQEGAN